MGLTSARVSDAFDFFGMHQICFRDFTGDANYPSGGYAIAASNFGFGPNKILKGIVCVGGNAAAANFEPYFDNVNKKLVIGAGGVGEYTYAESDIKGSTTTDVPIAGGSLPTNGNLISTLAAANNTSNFTIALQPDVPRNISISFKNTNAGASTGNAVSCVITGLFRGVAQTETISFSALELTSTAQNEVATKFGSKPFDSITSITNPVAQPAAWQHGAGPGSKLGLDQPTLNNAEADILKLLKNAADLPKTGLYSTNGTINFGVLADGDDISATYLAGTQAPPGTNLTGATWRLMGIAR